MFAREWDGAHGITHSLCLIAIVLGVLHKRAVIVEDERNLGVVCRIHSMTRPKGRD